MMCNIWQTPWKDPIDPAVYLKLPPTLKDINVSGGEPFLREDLPEVIRNLRKACPEAQILISTNGYLPEVIEKSMKKILQYDKKIAVGISVDGIGEMNNHVRGTEDAYGKAMASLNVLRRLGVKNLRLAYTGHDLNISHMSKVYEITRENHIQFTCALTHNSEHYFKTSTNKMVQNAEELKKQFNYVVKREIRSLAPRRWARAFFENALYNYNNSGKRVYPCRAMYNSFFLDPDGVLFPCTVLNMPIGNLTESSFEQLWRSEKSDELRKIAVACNKCWMVCSARASMKKHWARTIAWILRNKFQSHLGFEVIKSKNTVVVQKKMEERAN